MHSRPLKDHQRVGVTRFHPQRPLAFF